MSDILDIGSARLDASTNTVLVQAKSTQIGSTPDDAPSFDDAPVFGALGVVAMPAPANENGNVQALGDESVPGHNVVIKGMRDTRTANVVQRLAPGETGVYATGEGHDSLALFKRQLLALMVGDDCAQIMDRENKRFTITCFGLHFELSEANGFVVTDGEGATIQLKGGTVSIMGKVVLGGRTPLAPLAYSLTPVVGTSGATTPAMGVFVGV